MPSKPQQFYCSRICTSNIYIRTIVLKIEVIINQVEVRTGDQILYDNNPVLDTIPGDYVAEFIVDCNEMARYIHLSSANWLWFGVYDYQVYTEKHIGSSVLSVTYPSGSWSHNPMNTVTNYSALTS